MRAWDQSLDSTDFYTVTAIWAHLDSTLVTLTIDGEEIETTPEHPFYIADNAWVAAGSLWLGARVKKADGGYGTISAISVVQQPQVMYNLTVDTAHTYHVGDEQWLVHNDCPRELVEAVEEYQTHLRNSYSNRQRPHVASVAVDESTGRIYRGTSGEPHPSQIHPDIQRRIDELPPGGRARHRRPPINCAECQALNDALLDGADEANLQVYSWRTHDRMPLERCPNCQITVPSPPIRIWSEGRLRTRLMP